MESALRSVPRWAAEKIDEQYDLVVGGAGISGLSAAYIYRRDVDPNARILVLDNHDDFGGHAKRNEFTIDGQLLLGFYDDDLFSSLGVGAGSFFDRETFGADYLAIGSYGFSDAIGEAPLSASANEELKRLYADEQDYLAGMTTAERRAVIESHSWRDYLEKFGGFGEEVLSYVQKWPHGVWAIGAAAHRQNRDREYRCSIKCHD